MSQKLDLGMPPIPTQSFISGKDLVDGVIVSLHKNYEVIDQAEDTPEMYKTKEGNGLVKANIIKPGQTLRYFFLDENGQEVVFDNASYVFLKAFWALATKDKAAMEAGKQFKITRTGESTSTKYHMEFIDGKDEEELAF